MQKKNSSRGTYHRDPNTEIHLIKTNDQMNEEEVAEVNLIEVLAIRP